MKAEVNYDAMLQALMCAILFGDDAGLAAKKAEPSEECINSGCVVIHLEEDAIYYLKQAQSAIEHDEGYRIPLVGKRGFHYYNLHTDVERADYADTLIEQEAAVL